MKKQAQSCLGVLLIGLAGMTTFSSCKKDELNSRELLVYLQGDYANVDNRMIVPFVHNPLEVTGNTMVEVTAYTTREIPADIDVYIYPDPGFVAGFNAKYGKMHLALPEANYRVLNTYKHKINAGSSVSDPIQVEILNPGVLTNPAGYLLPLSITSIESKDKGARISTTHRVVYLNVTYEFNNVKQTQVPLGDPLMSRTGWSVTVSNTTSGATGPAMLDGNNSTAWRSSNSSTAAKWAILNMGSVQTIKGFQVVPNYVNTNENATQIAVSTSVDNVTYTSQGIWKGTGPAGGTSAGSPDLKGINFVAPVAARYFRFDITAWVSGNRVGIGELNAIQ